jgi:poly-gamma-glutamate synthesis protein (capsule biosynthesis protein)
MYNIPNHYRPGAFLYDEYIVCNELKLLKDACDHLIVVYHGGAEKFRYPSPQTQQRFHRMADSGADIILSQHTHCVGCEEYYKGSYFLYGQGNFLFRSFNNEYTDTGLIVEILIDEDSFSVRKHLVRAVDDYVRYDDKQDFSDFNLRSEKVIDSAFIQQMFDEYCLNELPLYLKAYKGKNLFYKVIGHYFPELNKKLLLRSYNRQQLLFTLHSLRSEQNQEVAINGIKVLLERKK